MNKRYLKQAKTGAVYPWTEQLEARKDMQECDEKGNLVEPPPKVAEKLEGQVSAETAEAMALEAANGVKAELVEVANARFGTAIDPNMPVDQLLDAILTAHEEQLAAKPNIEIMTKAQMVAHAKEAYGTDIDPDMKADAMRDMLRSLAAA